MLSSPVQILARAMLALETMNFPRKTCNCVEHLNDHKYVERIRTRYINTCGSY